MKHNLKFSAIFILLLANAGCIDKSKFETAPVTVSSEKGDVICQLYSENTTLLDEAISVPAGMSIKTGDALCKSLGERLLQDEELNKLK